MVAFSIGYLAHVQAPLVKTRQSAKACTYGSQRMATIGVQDYQTLEVSATYLTNCSPYAPYIYTVYIVCSQVSLCDVTGCCL